jgi:hypothetical protein
MKYYEVLGDSMTDERRSLRPKCGHSLAASLAVVLLLAMIGSATAEVTKVVVVPLGSRGVGQKELYIPAQSFRPLNAMTLWQYEAGGGIIRPMSSGFSRWIAPLLLPKNSRIISVELVWKNVDHRSGTTHLSLRVFNEVTGNSGDVFNASSSVATEGVHSIQVTPDFTIFDPIHPMIYVSLSTEYRWLYGAKVVYVD